MRLVEYAGRPDRWDAFVRSRPGWTHPHLYGWRRIIEDVLGHECLYLAAVADDGELRGVLPLVRVRSLVFGHYLVSMPFLNYGGPLGDEVAVEALAREAAARAAGEGVDLLELRSRRPLTLPLEVSRRKIAVLLDLPDEPSVLWDALESKVRSQVRRPGKEGIEMRFGPDQLDPFYEVFAHHMRDLGTPVLPRALFEAVLVEFGADVWLGCAYHEGRPVACGAGFRWDSEFEMTWASALWDYSRMAPNMLVYWSFMERAIEEGLSLFNFGRCTPDSGTHRFKRQWGTRDEQLWWYQQSRDGLGATPSPEDDTWAWGPRVWSKLPVPVATALGPRIVKYIP